MLAEQFGHSRLDLGKESKVQSDLDDWLSHSQETSPGGLGPHCWPPFQTAASDKCHCRTACSAVTLGLIRHLRQVRSEPCPTKHSTICLLPPPNSCLPPSAVASPLPYGPSICPRAFACAAPAAKSVCLPTSCMEWPLILFRSCPKYDLFKAHSSLCKSPSCSISLPYFISLYFISAYLELLCIYSAIVYNLSFHKTWALISCGQCFCT